MIFMRERFAKQLCLLLFMSMAVLAIYAQSEDDVQHTTLQGINRPLRSIPPDSSISNAATAAPSFLTTNSLSHSPLSLLSPEILTQPLTTHYINQYSGSGGIKWLNSIISNSSIYLPFVKEEIARRGLPPELAYLPFIESGYLSTARSKSGATGLWQFMMNSIAPFGIRVNDLIDERRDFRKSTVAALKKLDENYRALGDWPLALAAYNAGLGGVSRIVKSTKIDDYWLLCAKKEFKTETIHYVPKFLAVAYILSNPRQFNLDYWPDTVEWTTIKPEKQVSLDVIAAETGINRTLLQRLNTELLYGISPADKNYELKVPPDQAEAIAGLLQKEDIRLLHFYRYKVQYGDTLFALSRHYNVSLDMIEEHNPGILNRYLKIGETVIIPAFKEADPYTGVKIPSAAPSAGAALAASPKTGSFSGTHIVSKGDTLWSLAIRYQIDPQLLAAENNMELNEILSIGKALKVPIIVTE